jgi:hypothetical protein
MKSYKEILEGCKINMAPIHLGRALRLMGLTLWRERDGYHAAWSEEQLSILMKHFG